MVSRDSVCKWNQNTHQFSKVWDLYNQKSSQAQSNQG